MESKATLPEESRRQVRRIVLLSRLAGGAVALALLAMTFVAHWGDMYTAKAVAQLVTVAIGTVAFFALSTLARLGHTRIIERSLTEVQRLTEELRAIAETDPLTELCNLRSFQARLDAEIAAASESRQPVSLIVADLDNFKLLNDSFGHQYGDRVLKRTGEVFASVCEHDAAAARLGGDEFALILPGRSRSGAIEVAHRVDALLRELEVDERTQTTLGSFGIGTYPDDGETVQSLFAAADSRMYSEKHRRKAESLSSLTGAARKLFVRAGRAMRPEHSVAQILHEIAAAATEEFSLTVCAIHAPGREHHAAVTAVVAAHPEHEAACLDLSHGGALTAASLAAVLPGETWLIDAPIVDENGAQGCLLLAGQPATSFRPDTLVVLALSDIVQAAIANGRAHVDAVRAGRERDIHIDLARALASAGSLKEGLTQVTRMIADFIGVTTVSIEGVVPTPGGAPYNLVTAPASERALKRWEEARSTPEAIEFIQQLAKEAPCILRDPVNDTRIPLAERKLLELAGIKVSAVVPIRFDGQILGIVGAVSEMEDSFSEDTLTVLTTIADHLAPAIKVAMLRDELEASYAQLEQASRESLARLADAAEARDPHTGGHLRRIRYYSIELAKELGLPERDAEAIGAASAIHDLGKLQLPDAILLKTGALTDDDWRQMREHPGHGERLIGDSPMFRIERTVARWHHERWDGSGYPDGLAGEAIPIEARIVAVADAFDALTTERPYKRAWSIDEAFEEIIRQRAKLFCPSVVDALGALRSRGKLREIFVAAAGHGHGAAESARKAA